MELNQPESQEKQSPETSGIKIVGYNLLALLGYGIMCMLNIRTEGLILYAFLIIIHFCFVFARPFIKETGYGY